MRTLLVCFSYTDNTKMIAKRIKEKLNCDVTETKPTTPYSNDYEKVVEEEQNKAKSDILPSIEKLPIDISTYDRIIIGTPVWWYRAVSPIRAFIKNSNLENKVIVPFATNAGWLGKTFKEIKAMCKNNKVENEMNIVFGSYSDKLVTSEKDLDAWISSLKE